VIRQPRTRRVRPPVPRTVAFADSQQLAELLGIPVPAQLPATLRNVVGIPAATASVNKIANAVAAMMNEAQVLDPDGNPLDARPAVLDRPNWNYGRTLFWRELVQCALYRGNWVGLPIDHDESGWPQQIQPLPIDLVHAYVDRAGYIVYECNGRLLSAEQVVHIRWGVTVPGDPWCLGAIEAHRLVWEQQLGQQSMGKSVYTSSAVPSGIITVDQDVPTKEQREFVEDQWTERYGGGPRGPAVIGKRMAYQPLSWSPRDAEFIEARQFSVAETTLMFGLRPEDLGAAIGGPGMTYGNRTDDNLQRIIDSYDPLMRVVEDAWTDLVPGAVKGEPEALLRSSTRERYELHQIAQEIGLETAEETRQIERKPPRPTEPTPQPAPTPKEDPAP
jgi:HK97 family phage portal protein